MLKRLGNVLEDNDYVADNPLRKLKLPAKAKYVRQPFSQQEINAMWGVCFRTLDRVRDEAVFLLLIDTGMRIGELCSLRLEKLDLRRLRNGCPGAPARAMSGALESVRGCAATSHGR